MSSTSLLLLAMHATANAVGPAGTYHGHARSLLLVALFASALLSVLGIYLTSGPPRRPVVTTPAVRRINAPRPRRT